MWVKLGTATNFSIGITSNSISYAAGQTFTNASSGVNTTKYTQVSMNFNALTGQDIVINVGTNASGAAAQTAGTWMADLL